MGSDWLLTSRLGKPANQSECIYKHLVSNRQRRHVTFDRSGSIEARSCLWRNTAQMHLSITFVLITPGLQGKEVHKMIYRKRERRQWLGG